MRGGMLKITGLDKLQRDLEQAQKALEAIDGELGRVRFDPNDPSSIENAIASVEQMIDGRLGAYASNPIIKPLVGEMKEKYRGAILEKAAEARLKEGDQDDG
jgi:hypothetical protein